MILELLLAAGSVFSSPAAVLPGASQNDVIFSNHTGLVIARLEVGSRVYSGDGTTLGPESRILVQVSPREQTLKIVFRGGADVVWPHLNFAGVHEISFFRTQNHFEARIE